MQATRDPQNPEWGNPFRVIPENPAFGGKLTRRSETSQYPEEEKPNGIPPVAASEKGTAQTRKVSSLLALLFGSRGVPMEGAADPSESYKAFF